MLTEGRVADLPCQATITDPLNYTTTITPHATGHPAAITDAVNHTTQFTNDAGDLVAVTDRLGRTTTRFLGRRAIL